jgi:hypothetical protein
MWRRSRCGRLQLPDYFSYKGSMNDPIVVVLYIPNNITLKDKSSLYFICLGVKYFLKIFYVFFSVWCNRKLWLT